MLHVDLPPPPLSAQQRSLEVDFAELLHHRLTFRQYFSNLASQSYALPTSSIRVRRVTLDPRSTFEIQQFDPTQGGVTLTAYQVITEATARPVLHPLTNDSLYVRGGDRIGIASMNFDMVYNQRGYVVGLIDDVVCQAVIRNWHKHPPERDCWGDMVLFTEPYQIVAGIEDVAAYLETDFSFYTWEQPDLTMTRRVIILQMRHRYNETLVEVFHPVWLGVIEEDGSVGYSFTYDNEDGYYYGHYLLAREAAVIREDLYGSDFPAALQVAAGDS